jgi:hypothetical protein
VFVWIFRNRSHPDDPNKVYFDFFNLMSTPAQELPRPRHEHRRAAEGRDLSRVPGGEILDEDLYNLPRIQAGMRSSAFAGLHLGRIGL